MEAEKPPWFWDHDMDTQTFIQFGHFAHSIMIIVAIIFYVLVVISGIRTLYVLRNRSDFSLRRVTILTFQYIWSAISGQNWNRPPDGKAWGMVWVGVCFSTITGVIFGIKNFGYLLEGGSNILGLEWAIPWAVAHIVGSSASILFHAVIYTAAKNTPELL